LLFCHCFFCFLSRTVRLMFLFVSVCRLCPHTGGKTTLLVDRRREHPQVNTQDAAAHVF
jgi:hypothetical protein